MTGRELILYILNNNLENEPVVKDNKLLGFMTVAEASMKWNVGAATISAWSSLGVIESVRIGDVLYIPDIYEFSVEKVPRYRIRKL